MRHLPARPLACGLALWPARPAAAPTCGLCLCAGRARIRPFKQWLQRPLLPRGVTRGPGRPLPRSCSCSPLMTQAPACSAACFPCVAGKRGARQIVWDRAALLADLVAGAPGWPLRQRIRPAAFCFPAPAHFWRPLPTPRPPPPSAFVFLLYTYSVPRVKPPRLSPLWWLHQAVPLRLWRHGHDPSDPAMAALRAHCGAAAA